MKEEVIYNLNTFYFRWAAPGMEFLVFAIDPKNLETLTEEEFKVNITS